VEPRLQLSASSYLVLAMDSLQHVSISKKMPSIIPSKDTKKVQEFTKTRGVGLVYIVSELKRANARQSQLSYHVHIWQLS